MRRWLARIVRRLRTPRPGHIHLQPEATQRRPVLIPHQAKVAATEVAVVEGVTEAEVVVVAAEVAEAEVLTAEDPLLTLVTRYFSEQKARPSLPPGFLVLNCVLQNSSSKFSTSLALFFSFRSVLVPARCFDRNRLSLAHNSFYRRVLDEVEHSIPGSFFFDM